MKFFLLFIKSDFNRNSVITIILFMTELYLIIITMISYIMSCHSGALSSIVSFKMNLMRTWCIYYIFKYIYYLLFCIIQILRSEPQISYFNDYYIINHHSTWITLDF